MSPWKIKKSHNRWEKHAIPKNQLMCNKIHERTVEVLSILRECTRETFSGQKLELRYSVEN